MIRDTTFTECVAAFYAWAVNNGYNEGDVELKIAWIDAIIWREELEQREEGEES